jgi:hypothetical protein
LKSELLPLPILNNGLFASDVSDITTMFPLFIPVIATSPDAETSNERLVLLPVNNIEEAVNTVLLDPNAFNAYDAVNALNA